MEKVFVIGSGASGLTAAIKASIDRINNGANNVNNWINDYHKAD